MFCSIVSEISIARTILGLSTVHYAQRLKISQSSASAFELWTRPLPPNAIENYVKLLHKEDTELKTSIYHERNLYDQHLSGILSKKVFYFFLACANEAKKLVAEFPFLLDKPKDDDYSPTGKIKLLLKFNQNTMKTYDSIMKATETIDDIQFASWFFNHILSRISFCGGSFGEKVYTSLGLCGFYEFISDEYQLDRPFDEELPNSPPNDAYFLNTTNEKMLADLFHLFFTHLCFSSQSSTTDQKVMLPNVTTVYLVGLSGKLYTLQSDDITGYPSILFD